MAIGLKGSWKETKGYRLKHRLSRLKWNLIYAWQRAWRGYDATEVFELGYNFIERYKAILKRYRNNHMGLFNIPIEYQNDFGGRLCFNEKETDAILDTMIYHLEMMDEDYVAKVLYGKNVYDDDYDFYRDWSLEKDKHIASIVDQNKNAFMKLFTIFFWQLWD